MMTFCETHDTLSADYAFMEHLIVSAFPKEERRSLDALRLYSRENMRFHPTVIKQDGRRIGLMNYWTLDGMAYVEHFATLPEVRGQGYGRMALEEMKRRVGPMVLEVETPDSEMARRRIGFYERCGFCLCQEPYLQPPYRKGDSWFPLLLMFHGFAPDNPPYREAKGEIYRHVYGMEMEEV